MVSEREYERQAPLTLHALIAALDALEDEDFEAELASDILTVEFADGTKYIVNSHRAARQIWMAAELQAWHFDWQPDHARWVAEKTQEELWSTLGRVISGKLGRPLALEPSVS